MPTWSPATWDDFGVVGLAVFMVLLLFFALKQEWIVLGSQHREMSAFYKDIVATKDRTIERLEVRADEDSKAINTLTGALTEKNAVEQATKHLIEAFRETAAKRP